MAENVKFTQVTSKSNSYAKSGGCPWPCNLVPTNVPRPEVVQAVLHPGKDVFVLKVSKVGSNGDRRSKMELELVTQKFPEKRAASRYDTRDSQCDPDPPRCVCCVKAKPKRKYKSVINKN